MYILGKNCRGCAYAAMCSPKNLKIKKNFLQIKLLEALLKKAMGEGEGNLSPAELLTLLL